MTWRQDGGLAAADLASEQTDAAQFEQMLETPPRPPGVRWKRNSSSASRLAANGKAGERSGADTSVVVLVVVEFPAAPAATAAAVERGCWIRDLARRAGHA